MLSGAKISTISRVQIRVARAGLPTGPPTNRPRAASLSADTGLTFAHACSQPGIVRVGAKTELPNVNGRNQTMPTVAMPWDPLTARPAKHEIQESANANTST